MRRQLQRVGGGQRKMACDVDISGVSTEDSAIREDSPSSPKNSFGGIPSQQNEDDFIRL